MKNEPMFTPSYSIKTKTQITNKVTGMKAFAGAMEKLRYKVALRRATAVNKVPFRVLSSEPYQPKNVTDFRFKSGAKMTGRYGPLGMDGFLKFIYPDGSIYTGHVLGNKFAGEGMIKFPNGGQFSAFWIQGVAFNPHYVFPDGLHYEYKDWDYCTMPDRRFFSEFDKGLNPSGNIQLSNNHPAPALPVGSYDSGEGYFNPFSREMIHPITGKFLRIPSQSERRWILNHCRREWITPLPFDPTLYENWFPKYNEEISVKKKSIWQTIHDCFGEMSGMEGKIESLITFKPSSLNTSKDKLAEINTLMNKSFYAQPNNNDSLKF
ncbi:MORN repeat-containing protein 5 isoform X1 [Halyomorpha halys]|uniref:MORN repeat-containing protein 5 isoform X1 n=1 Tax=Halyomorpha halys TaxID=286706 RepID=UPI0006D52004|nr:MORN repeat-containing protein 5 isoform X1 [Halyomorpha halys]